MPDIWDVALEIFWVQTVLRPVDKLCLVTAGRTRPTIEQHEAIGLKVVTGQSASGIPQGVNYCHMIELSCFCLWKTQYFIITYNGVLLRARKMLNVILFCRI